MSPAVSARGRAGIRAEGAAGQYQRPVLTVREALKQQVTAAILKAFPKV